MRDCLCGKDLSRAGTRFSCGGRGRRGGGPGVVGPPIELRALFFSDSRAGLRISAKKEDKTRQAGAKNDRTGRFF